MLLNRGGREGKNGSQHDGIHRVRLIGRSPVDNASRWVLNRRRKTCLIKFQQKGEGRCCRPTRNSRWWNSWNEDSFPWKLMHYVTILGNVRSNSLFNRITHCKNSCENSIRPRTINMQGTQGGAASNVCFGSDICFRIKCSPRLRKTLFRSPPPSETLSPSIHDTWSTQHPTASDGTTLSQPPSREIMPRDPVILPGPSSPLSPFSPPRRAFCLALFTDPNPGSSTLSPPDVEIGSGWLRPATSSIAHPLPLPLFSR